MPQQVKRIKNKKEKPNSFVYGVIASIMPKTTRELRASLIKTIEATSIEIRLDHMWQTLDDSFADVVSCISKPVILTFKTKGQGGHEEMSLEKLWTTWSRLPTSLDNLINTPNRNVFVDWGYDLIEYANDQHKMDLFSWNKIGVSWHDFTKTPSRGALTSILRGLIETKAGAFIKIVPTAQDVGDISIVESLFRDYKDSRPLIAFLMGEEGQGSRIECISWGSAGTYGYIIGLARSAPGQLSVTELVQNDIVRKALGLPRLAKASAY